MTIRANLLLDVINSSTGRNYTTTHKMRDGVLSGEFKFSGTLHVSIKDQKLLLEQGRAMGVELATAQTVLNVIQQAADDGYLDQDGMNLIRYIGGRAGLDMKSLLSSYPGQREDSL